MRRRVPEYGGPVLLVKAPHSIASSTCHDANVAVVARLTQCMALSTAPGLLSSKFSKYQSLYFSGHFRFLQAFLQILMAFITILLPFRLRA